MYVPDTQRAEMSGSFCRIQSYPVG